MMSQTKSKMHYGCEIANYEFIPNITDFIPVDTGERYNNFDGDSVILGKIKSLLCVVCQVILILVLLMLLALVHEVNNLKHKSVDNLPQFLPPLPLYNENVKLRQQYNRIIKDIHLLKGEISNINRWREKQLKVLQTELENALERYDADKIGLIDYALKTSGGYVVSTPNTFPYEINENRIMGFINRKELSDPQLLLQPGILPGQCFAFEGSEGRIRIKLKRKIIVTSVTLEHVYRNLVEDVGISAPKTFEVIGLEYAEDKKGNVLGRFTYRIEGRALQTFQLPNVNVNNSYEYVELHILSNYGHKKYTCIYRFRVHGIPLY